MDEMMFIFDEDGVAHEYNDEFDVTVHCESEKESEKVVEWLNLGKQMSWRTASNPPPTHVDEWDADGEHYHFDVSDEVWIFCSDGTRLLGRYDKESGWFESNGPQISNHNHGSVTHWMPLPEPPKGVA
nr:MAG TPA: Protein of unknown function (DUF551) [Bacteriophage sp.]